MSSSTAANTSDLTNSEGLDNATSTTNPAAASVLPPEEAFSPDAANDDAPDDTPLDAPAEAPDEPQTTMPRRYRFVSNGIMVRQRSQREFCNTFR